MDTLLASEKEALRKTVNAVGDADLSAKLSTANEELLRHVSPLGALGLPKLLDEKRVKHGIPDEAFRIQAVYDVVYLVQLPSEGGDKWFDGGLIIRPDTRKAYDDKTTPKAVIVSAGLRALDDIRSHGMDLGHTIYFQRLSPFCLEYAKIAAVPYYFTVITSGDITGSIDLMDSLKSGDLTVIGPEENTRAEQHEYFSLRWGIIPRIDREKQNG